MSEETRVRQRYADLIVRPQARAVVRHRATVVRTLRSILHDRGFIEVETPMLQFQHGGATARPFVTHANAIDSDLYLRIAPELFLKRCVVGGIERVFEINRNFRNEGIDSSHSPEFAMLEAYQAYATYDDMAELTRTLVQASATAVFGSTVVRHVDGSERDLGGQWRSVTLHDAVSEAVSQPVDLDTSIEELRKLAATHDVELADGLSAGEIVLELFEKLVEHTLVEPTFVRDYPVEVRPLTRQHRDRAATGRSMGPDRFRNRAGDRVLRTGGSRRAARTVVRPIAARGGRRRRGDAARRGLPPGDGVRNAALRAVWEWASTGC